jgi:ABC-2 type transport system permease protein
MTALRTEWIKLRSVRSTTWALLAVVGLTIALGVVSCSTSHTEGAGPGDSEHVVVRLSLVGVYFAQVAVVAFAALAIGSEYATGTIRATFIANPRRREVLAAKAATVGALVLGAGAAAAVASFFVGQAILHANGYTTDNGYAPASLGDADTLRTVAIAAVYPMLLAVVSLGIAAIVRGTAAAISLLLGALFVPWIVGGLLPERLAHAIQTATPMAGIAAQEDGAPVGPWAGLGATVAWAVAALAVALWLIARRDA